MSTRLRRLGYSESAAARLAQAGTPLDLEAGTALTTEGERGEEAFLLLEGEAVVQLPHGDVVVGPGSVIGEIAALDPFTRRTATVVATQRCLVLVYDVATFRGLASTDLRSVLVPQRTLAAA